MSSAEEIVAAHGAGWLADAACLGHVLDWRGFGQHETLHVLDAAALPPESRRHVVAWTAPGLRPLLSDWLRDDRDGPVVVIDVAAVFRNHVAITGRPERECVRLGRLETQQTLLHELAHVREHDASGQTLRPDTTLDAVLAAAARPQSRGLHDRGHGLQWVRAYAHLSYRATELWPWRWWLDVGFSSDVEAHGLGSGDAYVETLADELESGRDESLVDILRRDPPAAFTKLFRDRVALRDAARSAAA